MSMEVLRRPPDMLSQAYIDSGLDELENYVNSASQQEQDGGSELDVNQVDRLEVYANRRRSMNMGALALGSTRVEVYIDGEKVYFDPSLNANNNAGLNYAGSSGAPHTLDVGLYPIK